MVMSKLFIAFISVWFLCGSLGLFTPTASHAVSTKKDSFPLNAKINKLFKQAVCGKRNPGERFVTSWDGTEVCDRNTGEIWEQNPNSKSNENIVGRVRMSQTNAREFCENLGQSKKHGGVYELPSIQQLVAVLDYGKTTPPIVDDAFSNVVPNFYWSATPFAAPGGAAWVVDLIFHGFIFFSTPEIEMFVWCVRRDKDVHGDW